MKLFKVILVVASFSAPMLAGASDVPAALTSTHCAAQTGIKDGKWVGFAGTSTTKPRQAALATDIKTQ